MFRIKKKCPYCKEEGISAKMDRFGITFICEHCLTQWNTGREGLNSVPESMMESLFWMVSTARQNREMTES